MYTAYSKSGNKTIVLENIEWKNVLFGINQVYNGDKLCPEIKTPSFTIWENMR